MSKTEAKQILISYILNGNIAGQFEDDDELVIAAKTLSKA